MTYPHKSDLTIVRMTSNHENAFLDKLDELSETGTDKNRDWYPQLRKDYTRFEQWYLTLYDSNIISFCAVQRFDDHYRLNSRQWNGLKKRGIVAGVKVEEMSPAMLMLKLELEDFPNNQFISMEYVNRRRVLALLSEKINRLYDLNFELKPDLYCTVPTDESKAWHWQSIISNVDLPFKYISIEEYVSRFSNQRKR